MNIHLNNQYGQGSPPILVVISVVCVAYEVRQISLLAANSRSQRHRLHLSQASKLYLFSSNVTCAPQQETRRTWRIRTNVFSNRFGNGSVHRMRIANEFSFCPVYEQAVFPAVRRMTTQLTSLLWFGQGHTHKKTKTIYYQCREHSST
jgi:hypothetical protein